MSKTWTKYTYIALRPKGSLKFPNDLVVLTAWFQVSQSPLLSSPPMAAADPVQSTDKSAKKCSSSQVSRFGIEITASVTAPENHPLYPQLNNSLEHRTFILCLRISENIHKKNSSFLCLPLEEKPPVKILAFLADFIKKNWAPFIKNSNPTILKTVQSSKANNASNN